jgi:RNA recognition motif-containing protein
MATNPEAQQPAAQQPNTQQPSQQQQQLPGKRIIVRNLPPGISKEELRELGDRYGRVITVELVPKPARSNPFGFISFLSQDDAEYSIYRLNGYLYKNYPLMASFSNSKTQPKPKTGPNNNKLKTDNKEKKKKPMYSLRTLTPMNPPTPSPQQALPNYPPNPKAWDNPAGLSAPAPANNNNHQPVDNGYVQTNDKTGKGNSGKGRRNNNINRSRGNKNYKQAAPEVIEEEPTESVPPQDSNVSVTEVQISIANQLWTLKLGPEQLEDFLKAVDPFLQVNEFH